MDEKTIAFLQLNLDGRHNPQHAMSSVLAMLGYWRSDSSAWICLFFLKKKKTKRAAQSDVCRTDISRGEAHCGAHFSFPEATVTAEP